MLKVVTDTNILISAYLFDKKPEKLLRMAKSKKISLYHSVESHKEFKRVLKYNKFKLNNDEINLIIEDYISYSTLIKIKKKVDLIKIDKTDNVFLSIAENVNADIIISGDKHLLELKNKYKITILNINDFFEMIKSH